MKDNDLLDSAAKVFRERMASGSRFEGLLGGRSMAATRGNDHRSVEIETSEINLPYTLRLSRIVESTAQQVGDMPPAPPTMRGRTGAVLVQAIRRALFWYTGQIRAFQGMVAE